MVQEQAEAHAEAARQFIMAELVTKADLQTALTHVDAKLDNLGLRLTVRLGVLLAAGIAILERLSSWCSRHRVDYIPPVLTTGGNLLMQSGSALVTA